MGLFFLYLMNRIAYLDPTKWKNNLVMQSDVSNLKKKKKGPGIWTIGWGWFVVIPTLFWLIKSSKKVMDINRKTISPLDIIKMRYAKGEIDRDEYEEKLRDLSFNSMAP